MNKSQIKSQTTQILYQPPRPDELVYKPNQNWFKNFIMGLAFMILLCACTYVSLVSAADEQILIAEKYSQLNKGSR